MSTNMTELSQEWSKETIKSLRLRLGWSQSDLARRLNCASTEVDSWEKGVRAPGSAALNELFLVLKQADACSEEIHNSPLAETLCDEQALGQIQFSDIKEEIE